MTSPSRIKEVFQRVIELPTGERATALDEACGDDTALRTEVEELLAAREDAGDWLARPTVAPPSSARMREGPGSEIGAYTLLEQIGEGGFGVVYEAEQIEPVRRRVAVKILKPGMDTRQVLARFEAERQALAMMSHPHIARVLDAGETDSGRPYFVMELVKGTSITAYCDDGKLSVESRITLFRQVCQAVQHAHQKGVIHRDLKPSNILVAEVDGQPLPKIIDFGIAKATLGRLTDTTLLTEFKMFVGTPEYMSPEQAASEQDIDTRSDIYALGVLLYELVAGTPPFDTETLRAAAWDEMRRIIREVEPPPPSTRLSSLERAANIAAQRMVEPSRLIALIRGDVDWVILRCLEKERSRRYDTAGDLAADLGRFLEGEPVDAAPPSRSYRLRKFVRRHRLPVAAALAVGFTLVLGIVGTSTGLVWALSAESKAEHRADRLAEELAFRDKHIADLDTVLHMTGSRSAMRRAIPTAREVLQDRMEHLGPDNRHTIAAMSVLGRRLHLIDADAEAEEVLREAADRGRHILEPNDPFLAAILWAHGMALYRLGHFVEARDVCAESVAVARRSEADSSTRDVWIPYCRYGQTLTKLNQFAEAEEVLIEAFQIRQAVLGEDARPGDPAKALVTLYRRWHEVHPDAGKDADLRYWRDHRRGVEPGEDS